MDAPDVSVVIPTYNEAETIGDLVPAVRGHLADREHEIVVVDGDSDDGTADIVQDMASGDASLRLIEQDERQGIGAAYQRAFAAVNGDVVVQMDADHSHPPERIPALVAAVEDGCDVAVGSRYVDGGERHDPFHRRLFPLIGSYLYRGLLRSPVKDVTSGFKAYRRDHAERLSETDLPDGFHFQAASLFHLLENGATAQEVPITFRDRAAGEPKYEYPWDLLDNALLLAKLGLRRHSRMLKFGFVGGIGVLVNMGLLYLLTEMGGLHYLISAGIAVESAIISNFVLNDLWTFADRRDHGWRNWLERFTKFQGVSLAGLALNVALLWAFTELLGIYYLLSNLIAIGIVFLWNYGANVSWTW